MGWQWKGYEPNGCEQFRGKQTARPPEITPETQAQAEVSAKVFLRALHTRHCDYFYSHQQPWKALYAAKPETLKKIRTAIKKELWLFWMHFSCIREHDPVELALAKLATSIVEGCQRTEPNRDVDTTIWGDVDEFEMKLEEEIKPEMKDFSTQTEGNLNSILTTSHATQTPFEEYQPPPSALCSRCTGQLFPTAPIHQKKSTDKNSDNAGFKSTISNIIDRLDVEDDMTADVGGVPSSGTDTGDESEGEPGIRKDYYSGPKTGIIVENEKKQTSAITSSISALTISTSSAALSSMPSISTSTVTLNSVQSVSSSSSGQNDSNPFLRRSIIGSFTPASNTFCNDSFVNNNIEKNNNDNDDETGGDCDSDSTCTAGSPSAWVYSDSESFSPPPRFVTPPPAQNSTDKVEPELQPKQQLNQEPMHSSEEQLQPEQLSQPEQQGSRTPSPLTTTIVAVVPRKRKRGEEESISEGEDEDEDEDEDMCEDISEDMDMGENMDEDEDKGEDMDKGEDKDNKEEIPVSTAAAAEATLPILEQIEITAELKPDPDNLELHSDTETESQNRREQQQQHQTCSVPTRPRSRSTSHISGASPMYRPGQHLRQHRPLSVCPEHYCPVRIVPLTEMASHMRNEHGPGRCLHYTFEPAWQCKYYKS